MDVPVVTTSPTAEQTSQSEVGAGSVAAPDTPGRQEANDAGQTPNLCNGNEQCKDDKNMSPESIHELPIKKQKMQPEEETGPESATDEAEPGTSTSSGGSPPANITPAGDATDKQQEEPACACSSGRNLRKVRKKTEIFTVGQSATCPICRASLRPSDVHSHVNLEIEKLNKIGRGGRKSTHSPPTSGKKVVASTSCDKQAAETAASTDTSSHSPRYQTYLRIKKSREQRLVARKRRKRPGDDEATCPVCNQLVVGTQEELAEHVDVCLKQEEDGEMGDVDIEGEDAGDTEEEEEYEEYTWAGQTRIRVTSLLPGGLSGSGFQSSTKVEDEADDGVDLNVDDDETDVYGKPQYTEADVIPCTLEEPAEEKERKAIRKAMLGGKTKSGGVPVERSRWTEPQGEMVTRNDDSSSTDRNHDNSLCDNFSDTHDKDSSCPESAASVAVLKAKVQAQAEQLKLDRPKCLICMESHSKPAVSIQCWHVHCEECWLRTLGVKKLCPQCNTITSAADLRRIFL